MEFGREESRLGMDITPRYLPPRLNAVVIRNSDSNWTCLDLLEFRHLHFSIFSSRKRNL